MKCRWFFIMVVLGGMLTLSACKGNNVPAISGDEEVGASLTPVLEDSGIKDNGTDLDSDGTIIGDEGDVLDNSTEVIFAIDELNDEEIKEHSFKLAEQMAKGRFEDTALQFSEVVNNQLDEESLKTVWDSTVLLIGKYKGIAEELYIEETSGEYKISLVVLKYETSGLSISFTYNKAFEIDGLYIDYYQLEQEIVVEDNSDSRETVVMLGTKEYPIEGRLTIPNDVEKPPVVILIQGSGQSDMDETIGIASNKPFRDIARGLADRGIASLRYNKRFYSYTGLADITSDIYDEVLNDASDAVKLVLLDERLDSERIYIAGHSLGGMLAPMIAKMNEEVIGIISLAGSPRKLEDIIYDQNKDMLIQLGVYTEDEINALLDEIAAMVLQVKNLSEDNLDEPILGATGHYWKSLNDIDTPQIARELDIPMLILQGSEDFQVYPDVDYVLWNEILSDKDNVRFCLYEGLNHLFMPSLGIRGTKDYDEAANVSEDVLNDIASWILTGELK